MPAIEALIAAAAAAFFGLIALVLIVTVGIHQEERKHSFLRAKAPSAVALVARRVLGLYVKKSEAEPAARGKPEQPVPWYEHSM